MHACIHAWGGIAMVGWGCHGFMIGARAAGVMDDRLPLVIPLLDRLIMAGGHCHSPACLSLELYDEDKQELLCRVTPRMGQGDAVWDEAGYVWLPPCQWGDAADGLRPPPVLSLDANLSVVKQANVTAYHYGVMGIFQMRGAYLD